jgi:hypothetical protein
MIFGQSQSQSQSQSQVPMTRGEGRNRERSERKPLALDFPCLDVFCTNTPDP